MTAKERETEAQSWDREELLRRWESIKQGNTSNGWQKGTEFEYLVVRAFELEDVVVKWPFRVTHPQRWGTMEQFDGLVYHGERAFLIESKNLSDPTAIEAVAKLRFRLEGRPPGTMGILFSTSDFSKPTEIFTQFASPLNILLWDSSDLDYALASECMIEGLRQKLSYAISHGLPLFPLSNQ